MVKSTEEHLAPQAVPHIRLIVEDPALGQDAITDKRDWHASAGDAGPRTAFTLVPDAPRRYRQQGRFRLLVDGKSSGRNLSRQPVSLRPAF
ncbi:hypothetical protein AGR1C_pAt40336 [Agrobacterium fabacearum TT111]|nr:hypothetical protein AGR1C_pAt40336 [Agrobacterium fabacearum TT111]